MSADSPSSSSTLWQLARTGPWLRGLAGATCAALLCGVAGLWQWDRREARVASNQLVLNNYGSAPQQLDQAVTGAVYPEARTWQRVTLTGSYNSEGHVLVRSRPLDGRPGSYALSPFTTSDGIVVFINRGWLPIDVPAPPPPQGKVTIKPHLRPAEQPDKRTPPAGYVFRIVPADMDPDVPAFETEPPRSKESPDETTTWKSRKVVSAYGQLGADTQPSSAVLRRLPKPEVTEGSHLSYSFQWFVFAFGCYGAWFVALRRSVQDGPKAPRRPSTGSGSSAESKTSARLKAMRRRRKTDDDMDAEDAAIDAHLNAGSN